MPLGTRPRFGIEISSSSTSELGIVISVCFVFLCFDGDAVGLVFTLIGEEARWEGPEMVVSVLEAREGPLFRFLIVFGSSRECVSCRCSVFLTSCRMKGLESTKKRNMANMVLLYRTLLSSSLISLYQVQGWVLYEPQK